MQKGNQQYTQSLWKSFGFAFKGIRFLLAERNFRIHILMGVLAIIMGFVLGLSKLEWCVIAITISLVLTAEAFNSVLEQICNQITTEHDPIIGRIKDISAAAVLILALSSLIIGALIFLPKII